MGRFKYLSIQEIIRGRIYFPDTCGIIVGTKLFTRDGVGGCRSDRSADAASTRALERRTR